MRPMTLCFAYAALTLTATGPGVAQSELLACGTQQSLEQSIASDGALRPEDCRVLSITPVRTDVGALCVIDVSGAGTGVIEGLRSMALPSEWWVRCDRLSAPGG